MLEALIRFRPTLISNVMQKDVQWRCWREPRQRIGSAGNSVKQKGSENPWGPLGRVTFKGQAEEDTSGKEGQRHSRAKAEVGPWGSDRVVERAGVFTPDPGSGRAADPSLPAVESNLSSAGASGGPREKTGRNTAGCMGNTSLGDRAKKQTRTAPGFDPAPGGEGEEGRRLAAGCPAIWRGQAVSSWPSVWPSLATVPASDFAIYTLARWPAWRLPAEGSWFSSCFSFMC